MLIVNGHDMVFNGQRGLLVLSCFPLQLTGGHMDGLDGWTVSTGHMDGHMIILSRPVIHWMGGHMQPGIITSASLGTFRAPTTAER